MTHQPDTITTCRYKLANSHARSISKIIFDALKLISDIIFFIYSYIYYNLDLKPMIKLTALLIKLIIST